MSGAVVVPASAAAFEHVEHALTGGGDGGACWCRWLLETRAAFGAASRDDRRAALRSELWHGTVGLFTRAGFTEASRPVVARPVMTLAV